MSNWKVKYGEGLDALARYLKENETHNLFANQFVDALTQARNDLIEVEKVVNDVWDMVFCEFNKLTDDKDYFDDQLIVPGDAPPVRPGLSSKSVIASGTA
jgi:hypothetical protein